MATTIRGGVEGSSTAFSAACSSGFPSSSMGGGGFRAKKALTAGEGAATGAYGPVAADAAYQNFPPDR